MPEESAGSAAGLLDCKQLGQRWGVSPGTIYNWISKGKIPGTNETLPYLKVGNRVRFSLKQIEYIESRMERRRKPRGRGGAAGAA